MNKYRKILLSFDIEEFDMPFEYQREVSFEEQIAISKAGTIKILDILKKHNVKATFFSTVIFAQQVTDVIKRIIEEGHELASHGYHHSKFDAGDYAKSKEALELISKTEVVGFRMARMQPVDDQLIEEAGYLYNSSVNPTYLPGRYNNLHVSRTLFKTNQVWQLPASVTPYMRFPLFWLSFHNLPTFLYQMLCQWTLKKDNYLNIYFHPWEFMPINDKRFNFPSYVNRNVGDKMCERLDKLIIGLRENNFLTIKEFINNQDHSKNFSN
jgi:hypothetical protein